MSFSKEEAILDNRLRIVETALGGLTASQFLRSDVDDSWSGVLTHSVTTTNGLEVGGIRGTALGSQTGDFIQLYERVNIGFPSGWGAVGSEAPSFGLSTHGAIECNMGVTSTTPMYIHGGSADWGTTTQGTSQGSIHLDPGSATNNYGSAITFGSSDHSNGTLADAGVYVRSDGAYGTKMYLSTTDSYAAGSKTAITIDEGGDVDISRGSLTVGNQPIRSGQIGSITDPTGPAVLKFDDHWVDQGGITYNASNGRFTVPEDGVYRITMNPFKKGSTGFTRVMIGINNSAPSVTTHEGHCYDGGTDFATMCLNSIRQLSANDYIVFYLSSGTLYNRSSDRFNQYTIEKIA